MRKAAIVFVVLLGLSLALLLLDQVAGLGVIKGALVWALAPLQGGLQGSSHRVGDMWAGWQQAEECRQRNEELQELVDYLTAENSRYQEIKRENEELRKLLGLRERYPDLELLYAEVIGHDPGGTQQVVRVGWGAVSDPRVVVREGMPVIAPAGLVGRVLRVYPNAADVLLITDVGSSVSAVVQNDDRPTGVVDGQWQLGMRLLMRYLPQDAVLHEGDWVLTSGLRMPPYEEEGYPPAIPIGRILRIEATADMHQQAELIPAVDLERLERVMIVVGVR